MHLYVNVYVCVCVCVCVSEDVQKCHFLSPPLKHLRPSSNLANFFKSLIPTNLCVDVING